MTYEQLIETVRPRLDSMTTESINISFALSLTKEFGVSLEMANLLTRDARKDRAGKRTACTREWRAAARKRPRARMSAYDYLITEGEGWH